jgi:hypothetical protein
LAVSVKGVARTADRQDGDLLSAVGHALLHDVPQQKIRPAADAGNTDLFSVEVCDRANLRFGVQGV